jgi:hypothetical protein
MRGALEASKAEDLAGLANGPGCLAEMRSCVSG